jgi:hypothetical protein
MKESMTSKGTGGLILGMAVGPILTMYLMRNEDDYKIWDRCYRLRNSKNQVRVDQDSVIGAVVGAGYNKVERSLNFHKMYVLYKAVY